ncbi:alpha-L-arabinofuranosidase [Amycolatopsis panacis]|uniref:Alpha-L-arabinofuranosidase n=2 Tax=Amycolatopsis panacis TaxID=2340917 RepID=A0A419HKI5_9PSEU|nr:alpha-L-arabinofuranosidase [Amycolatopsis panacis]
MTLRWRRLSRARKRLAAMVPVFLLAVVQLVGWGTANAGAATRLPCDVYNSGGTPCVAAHSTTRALVSDYDGALYQVTRTSDQATRDIGLLDDGYANAAQQDRFCVATTCTITKIYDQTPNHNDLTPGPAGTAGTVDRGAGAGVISVSAGGHKVYGIWISPGVGYRYLGAAKGVAVNGQPEGSYMVASGTHVNNECCFDYGNAEATPDDTGNGHMDAVSVTTGCSFPPCSGTGPWVEADLENGLFLGDNGANPANLGNKSSYVTAVLRNDGQTKYSLQGGDSQSGSLSTWWNGALPTRPGYRPMKQEGGIILGIGGDNSNRNRGTFFEGTMVSGFPGDETENAVQSNIVSVGYAGDTDVPNGRQGNITGPGGKCVDVAGEDTGTHLSAVRLWDCQRWAEDQFWTHQPDDTLSTISHCLAVNGDGTQVQLQKCTDGGQKWRQQTDGSLLNTDSGRCLESPDGATENGTALRTGACDGSAAQKFRLHS